MKSIKTLVFIILIGLPAQAIESMPHCEPYLEINEQLSCPAEGYFISFGYKYCRKFVETESEYSHQGQKTLGIIRQCLIHEISNEAELTCENARSRALEHHHVCYTGSGFCQLSFWDQFRIYRAVHAEIQEPDFKKTLKKIRKFCRRY